jgi:hypothetical protein
MPDLIIRIKKKSDGSAALSCLRADGSTTWQRQEGQLGRFLPMHDLTHYAVETVLGTHRGFYSLLAEGWDLSDFGKREMKARLPEDAGIVEAIVGFFDLERATGERGSADDLNSKLDAYREERGLMPPAVPVTDEQLGRVRALRADLFARWRAVPAGEALELSFDRETTSAASPDTNREWRS